MSDPNNTIPQLTTQPTTPFIPPTPHTPLPSSIVSSYTTPQQIRQPTVQQSVKFNVKTAKLLGSKIEFDTDPSIETKQMSLPTIDESTAKTHSEHIQDQSNTQHTDQQNIQYDTNETNTTHDNNVNNEAYERQRQFDYYMIQTQNENAQLKAQLQQQNAQLAQIQYAQSFYHQQQPQTTHVNYDVMKNIAKPDSFTGEMKADPDTWIAQMRNYLHLTGVQPHQQAQFAGTYLKSQAATWYHTLPMDERIQLTSFEALAKMILIRFRPLDVVGQARRQLAKLQQTGSVSAFNQLFMQLMQLIPKMEDDERISNYRTKLKWELQKHLVTQEYSRLSDIMNVALRTDALLYEHNNVGQRSNQFGGRGGKQNYYTSKYRSESSSQPSSAVAVNNVKVDTQQPSTNEYTDTTESQSVSLNYTAPTPMDEAERQRCRELNLCFRCRQPGHRSRSCTIFTSASNNRLRPSSELGSKKYQAHP